MSFLMREPMGAQTEKLLLDSIQITKKKITTGESAIWDKHTNKEKNGCISNLMSFQNNA